MENDVGLKSSKWPIPWLASQSLQKIYSSGATQLSILPRLEIRRFYWAREREAFFMLDLCAGASVAVRLIGCASRKGRLCVCIPTLSLLDFLGKTPYILPKHNTRPLVHCHSGRRDTERFFQLLKYWFTLFSHLLVVVIACLF